MPAGRQVKMAYVNSVAKPPRDVRRRQEKFGTTSGSSTAASTVAAAPIKSVPCCFTCCHYCHLEHTARAPQPMLSTMRILSSLCTFHMFYQCTERILGFSVCHTAVHNTHLSSFCLKLVNSGLDGLWLLLFQFICRDMNIDCYMVAPFIYCSFEALYP